MMNSRHAVAVLLGLVLGLCGVILYMALLLHDITTPVHLIQPTRTVTNTVTKVAPGRPGPKAQAQSPFAGFSWKLVESNDYRTYIANLRAIHCPEETIRDIIIADISELYARRRKDLDKSLGQFRFWETSEPGWASPSERERQQKLAALEEEKRNLIQELLGVDQRAELSKYLGEDENDRLLAFLEESKRADVLRLQEHYGGLESAVFEKAHGLMTDDDEARIRELRAEQRAELAKLLTPAELEEYDLRTSETASEMRTTLAAFKPTPEEFRAIFRLRQVFADNNGSQTPGEATSEADAAKLHAAGQKVQQQLKELLGEQRLGEYEKAQDPDYQNLAMLGRRFELPTETTGKVYAIKQTVEEQSRLVQEDTTLSLEEKKAALRIIKARTGKTITDALGEKAAAVYRRFGGNWLDELTALPETETPETPPLPPGAAPPN